MRKVVWKYVVAPISQPGRYSISLPVGATLLRFDVQGDALCVWAQVDPDTFMAMRMFHVLATGQIFSEGVWLATVFDGPYVWHIYEVKK